MSEFASYANKHLTIGQNVKLTPVIDPVISRLDPYFKDCPAVVTSGKREPSDQLRIMRQYIMQLKLVHTCPEIFNKELKPEDKLPNGDYVWQMAWSILMKEGIIINPCFAAKLLLDHFQMINDKQQNMKGLLYPQSNHIPGNAFNVGGSTNGPEDEAACVRRAIDAGEPGIVSYVLERKNNTLHVNCKQI